MENRAFHARHELDDTCVSNVLDELIDDVVAEIAVSHLPTTKAQAGFHLIAAGKELDGLILLGLVVMLVDGYGELDFLDDDDFLLLLSGAFALFFLVEETAIVLDAADRGNRVRRYLYKVESALAGNFERFIGRQDAELLAVFIDYANFAGANAIVDADKGLCRTFVECDGTLLHDVRASSSGCFGMLPDARTHPEYSTRSGSAGRAPEVEFMD